MTASKKTANENNGFDAFFTVTPGAFKEGYEKFAENMSAMTDFQKGSMEAMMKSAGEFSKGFEKIASENSDYVKTAYDAAVTAGKSAASAKSVQEAIEIQTEFARETFEKNMGQTQKVADLWVETTKSTVAPLTERYSELVEKIQSYRP
ncbi:MAG: phasin family protein [Pseudomonadota bacterium]